MWRSSGTTSVCVPTNDGTPGRWKTVGVTMLDDIARDLSVLSPIADNDQLTQRYLAKGLGVAVSLTTFCVRRPIRLRYPVIPGGIPETARLTSITMCQAFVRYGETRESLREAPRPLDTDEAEWISFYAAEEVAG